MKNIYISRINRVIDYINKNLDEELSLDKLAEVASFSKFHFHRIFTAFTGDTLNDFIKRIRLQRTLMKLMMNTEMPITEIALSTGFSSSANFSRVFKDYYGTTPSSFRKNHILPKHCNKSCIVSKNCKIDSNIGKLKSKNRKDISLEMLYNNNNDNNLYVVENKIISESWRSIAMNVEIKNMPEFKVVYIRYIGPYESIGISKVWERLCAWAGARDLFGPSTKNIGIGHDNPETTPPEKCRYDACITVDKEIEVSGEVGLNTIAGGKYAVYRYDGGHDGIKQAYHNLFAVWLPKSGYQPADYCSYEIYLNSPDKEGKFIMDICLPVKPL